jgi:esterase/lipase superfamily enzyme
MMLNKERVDNYDKCMKVIFSVGGETNYSPEGRQIAHKFSKQSVSVWLTPHRDEAHQN